MRNRLDFEQVTNDISTSIYERTELSQEQVFCFMEQLTADGRVSSDALETDPYDRMRDLLYEVWQYQEWEDMSAEQAFLHGQLYGCAKLCEYMETNHENIERMEILVSKLQIRLSLFQTVRDTPGIRHKELALKQDITPGRLTQIMNEKEMRGLFSDRTQGREKYYFLSPKGEDLLVLLEERQREKAAQKETLYEYFDNMRRYGAVYRQAERQTDSSFIKWMTEKEILVETNYVPTERMPGIRVGKNSEVKKACLTENSYSGLQGSLLKNGFLISSAK